MWENMPGFQEAQGREYCLTDVFVRISESWRQQGNGLWITPFSQHRNRSDADQGVWIVEERDEQWEEVWITPFSQHFNCLSTHECIAIGEQRGCVAKNFKLIKMISIRKSYQSKTRKRRTAFLN